LDHSLAANAARERSIGITIDGPTSRDLDDALWVETIDDRAKFRVFIADVAGTVHKDSAWDTAARGKGFTRYGPTSNWPMLPPALADDNLSLLPLKDRHAVSIEFELGPKCNPTAVRISETQFRSLARITYQEAAEIARSPRQPDATIEERDAGLKSEIAAVVKLLADIAMALLRNRRDKGDLAVYDVVKGWSVNEDGALQRISPAQSNVGYIIVQEFMILANKLVAEHLVRHESPALYRNHRAHLAAPSRESMLQDIETAFARPDLVNISTLQQRMALTARRAEYGAVAEGHYALNLPVYAHTTSPLRRYSDLVNQRILIALLRGSKSPYSRNELDAIASDINLLRTEDAARVGEHFKRKAAKACGQRLSLSASQLASVPTKDSGVNKCSRFGPSRFAEMLRTDSVVVTPVLRSFAQL
jgi:ribonuclease R